MDAKVLAEKIVADVEVSLAGKFEEAKQFFHTLIDECLVIIKNDINEIQTEAELDEVIKEILKLKITNEQIDAMIKLPAVLEPFDGPAIAMARPMIVNSILGFVKKQLIVRFGGDNWFTELKQFVANLG